MSRRVAVFWACFPLLLALAMRVSVAQADQAEPAPQRALLSGTAIAPPPHLVSSSKMGGAPPLVLVPGTPRRLTLQGELGTAVWPLSRGYQWVLSPLFALRYRFDREWAAHLAVGGVLLVDRSEGPDSSTTVALSNVWLGADRSLSPGLSLRLGIVAPSSYLGYDELSGQRRGSYGQAAAIRGLWNAFLWAPERAGAASALALSPTQALPGLWIGAEAGVAVTLPVRSSERRAGELYGQAAVDFLTNHAAVQLGFRAQAVLITVDGDGSQLSAGPLLRFNFPCMRVHGMWLLNIDEPLGRMGTGLDVSGLTASVEADL